MRQQVPRTTITREYPLTEREQLILRSVVQSFIQTGDPVGSRYLSRRFPIGLSPASIRNTLSDLEERGYLDHPYTSAGRVPTELGYRAYVEQLMEQYRLSPRERRLLRERLRKVEADTETILRESSRLMGELSHLLALALTPRFSTGTLERLDVIPIASNRVLFVLTIRGGLVRTLIFELSSSVRERELQQVVQLLNERLSGLTLAEIRETLPERVRDLSGARQQLIARILEDLPTLFDDPPQHRRICVGGTSYILTQPEFQQPEEMQQVMELLEQEEVIVQLLESPTERDTPVGKARVRIGKDHPDEATEKYSIVTAQYRVGDITGTIGILGPQRMDYSRVIALVETMAQMLSEQENQPETTDE